MTRSLLRPVHDWPKVSSTILYGPKQSQPRPDVGVWRNRLLVSSGWGALFCIRKEGIEGGCLFQINHHEDSVMNAKTGQQMSGSKTVYLSSRSPKGEAHEKRQFQNLP